jgi:hypothetical protein
VILFVQGFLIDPATYMSAEVNFGIKMIAVLNKSERLAPGSVGLAYAR